MKNLVIIIGNLGADPTVRYTQSGSQVATFNVATTERWTSGRCRMRMGRVG